MGQALARQFKGLGIEVVTALARRSARTQALAQAAGLRDVGNLEQLARECEVILSVMDPGSARVFAHDMAAAIRATHTAPLIVECNAIAPATMHEIHAIITATGAACLDAAVMGQPPTASAASRLFVSGPGARRLAQLATPQLSVHVVSERIGDASAVKMLDAVMSKGVTALLSQMLIAAQRLGVADALDRQCEGPRRYFHDWIINTLPIMPPKSYRWVPEVEEIAQTLEAVGVPGDMMRASAPFYAAVAATALGQETPEQRDQQKRSGETVATLLARTFRMG